MIIEMPSNEPKSVSEQYVARSRAKHLLAVIQLDKRPLALGSFGFGFGPGIDDGIKMGLEPVLVGGPV